MTGSAKSTGGMGDIETALTEWISAHIARSAGPPLLFVSGAQGIGKSTALRRIADRTDKTLFNLSIDDFYLTKPARDKLAQDIHPLFATRGPPGTHDLPLLGTVLDALATAGPGTTIRVPVFDKKSDDRVETGAWRGLGGRPDAVIVEGWLMGVAADMTSLEDPPLNAVEERSNAIAWRRYQEQQLLTAYRSLWDRADGFFHIDAPGFEVVRAWRLEQEATTFGCAPAALPPDRIRWVTSFILFYERLTRRMLRGKRRPGTVLKVDRHRRPVA